MPETSGKSILWRNFFLMARANTLALVLPALAAPFLARIFDHSAFALLGVLFAAIGIVNAFSTARMDWAVPNARADLMAASLVVVGGLVLCTVVVLSAICVAVLTTFPKISPRAAELGWIIWLIPFVVAAMGARALLHGWLVRTGELGVVARSTVVQTATTVGLSFATGLAGMVTTGLVIASAAASFVGISVLVATAGKRFVVAVNSVTMESINAALAKYGRQASWSTCVSILNAFALSSPTIILGILYSPREVGWYVLMQRTIATPIGALSTALGQSFWSYAAELALERRMEELSRAYKAVTLRLVLASIPVLGVCLLGPHYIGVLFGEKDWSGAGNILPAMAPLFIANLVFSPTNHLVVLQRQHLQLLVDALRLGLVIAGIVISDIWNLGFVAAVSLSSLGGFIGYATIYNIQLRAHAE
jgi:O-antigen/teichoic acid export membrane protein